MNERIRTLMEEVVRIEVDPDSGMETIYTCGPEDFEAYAELIVRECYEHCKGQVLDKEVADTNELTYNDAVSDCANGLLQHFGIE